MQEGMWGGGRGSEREKRLCGRNGEQVEEHCALLPKRVMRRGAVTEQFNDMLNVKGEVKISC